MATISLQDRVRNYGVDEAWLAQTREEPIEPELPIVDPHHHLWDFPTQPLSPAGAPRRYRQRAPDREHRLRRMHRLLPYRHAARACRHRRDRVRQRRRRHGGKRAVRRDAGLRRDRRLRGLDAERRGRGRAGSACRRRQRPLPRHSPCRGLGRERRRPQQPHPSAARALSRQGFPRGLRPARAASGCPSTPGSTSRSSRPLDLARAFPDQPIVLDHVGGALGIGPYAGRRDEIFQSWRGRSARSPQCSNVHVKLGDMA